MTGKPNKLVSQFRLTYGMVLSLLRVESLTVELMISKSFGEADHQKNAVDLELKLKQTEKKLENISKQHLSSYLQPLGKFFGCASAFLTIRNELMPKLINYPKVQKLLVPGAIVVITYKAHTNKLALILAKKTSFYKVLVLSNPNSEKPDSEAKETLWYQMLALAQDKLFLPPSSLGHEVITINASDIFEISSKTIKLDARLIESDWEKRQQERFKYDPPGKMNSLVKRMKSTENCIF